MLRPILEHMPKLQVFPEHLTIFRSAIFPTIFIHHSWSCATTYVFPIQTGIVGIFDLPFEDVLIQNARRSYGSRRTPQILSRYQTEPVRCQYGVPTRKVIVW